MRRFLACLALVGCTTALPSGDEAHPEASELSACEDAFAWQKLGPVGGLPEPGQAGDGILSPAVVEVEGTLHLWFSVKSGSRQQLMHGRSTDGGASFTDVVEVVGLGDGYLKAYPSVWRVRDGFQMVFGSGSVKAATSTDGVRFTVAPAPVLSASFDPSRFDALSVLYPSRVADEAGATLFFSGYDGQRLRIGRAVEGKDGTFAVDPPAAVLDVGAATAFDNSAVAQPHVQKAFGRWWMWYGGYDTSLTNPGPYRIGTASSADGIAWQKHGVAIDLSLSGTEAWSTRDPAVLPAATRWQMFYVGLGDDGRYRLHRAASDTTTRTSCRGGADVKR